MVKDENESGKKKGKLNYITTSNLFVTLKLK
jgi:hypothetical protein